MGSGPAGPEGAGQDASEIFVEPALGQEPFHGTLEPLLAVTAAETLFQERFEHARRGANPKTHVQKANGGTGTRAWVTRLRQDAAVEILRRAKGARLRMTRPPAETHGKPASRGTLG